MEPKHGSTPGIRENVTSRIRGNSDWPSLKGGNPQPVLVHHSTRAKQCVSPFPIQNLPHSEHILDSRLASLSHLYETVAVNPASINPPAHTPLQSANLRAAYVTGEKAGQKVLRIRVEDLHHFRRTNPHHPAHDTTQIVLRPTQPQHTVRSPLRRH